MGERYALIIANFEYDYIRNLNAPKYDAEELEKVLADKGFGGFDCKLLINENSSTIVEEMEEFYDNKKKDDVLLLYYSGHGIKDKRRNLYLTFKKTSEGGDIVKKAIKVNELNDKITLSQSKNHIIILDCCYSGAMELSSKDAARYYQKIEMDELSEFIGGEGRVILTSSSQSEKSYEKDNISHYTEAVIEGIKSGKADYNNDGIITVNDIHEYVCKKLEKTKPEQKPRIKSDLHKSLVISKARKRVEEVKDKSLENKGMKEDKITILFLPSSPSIESKDRFEKEYREIEENIKKSQNRDKLKLVSKWAVRKKDLLQAINEYKPDILHVSGSGSGDEIIFEEDLGVYKPVTISAMKKFIEVCTGLKMVVFNKSNSTGYAINAVESVEFAVGMSGNIDGDKAIAFSYRLYSSLAFDKSIEESFNQAVVEVNFYGDKEAKAPRLYKRGIANKINEYKNKAKKDFEVLGVVGFKQRFYIDDIYIPLTIHIDKDSDIRGCKGIEDHCFERQFKAERLLSLNDKVAVVLGKPGMGKTTMLRYLGRIESKKEDGLLPIYIRLSEFSKKNNKLEKYIVEAIKDFVDDEEWIKNEVLKRNGLLLLDGLDEVSEENYNYIVDEINTFITNNSECRVIITSRLARFKVNLFHYRIYEIDKLPLSEIEKYIDKWFEDIEIISKDKEIANLKLCVKYNKRIFELAENPFLLSIICIIYEQDKKLPNRRVELYERCTSMLLSLYDIYEAEKKNIYISSLKEKVLEDIAYYFFAENEDNVDEFSKRDIVDQVSATLNRLGKDNNTNEERILAEICENSGILQNSNNDYMFVHRTFYEYYAACKFINDKGLRDKILENFDKPKWEEPIRLYAGMIKKTNLGTEFIMELWNKDKAFAIRCYADMENVDPEVIKKLLGKAEIEERVELVKGLPEKVKEPEKVVETLKGLFKNETNGEVLYWGFDILENREGIKELDEAKEIINEFDEKAKNNYEKYMKEYMVEIPADEFMMGDETGYGFREERPVHKVRLDDFMISKFIVTNKLYEMFDPEHKKIRDEKSDKDSQPVIYVNWYEAYMFCRWCRCKLPTEAQWEYACRAGTKTTYSVGDELTSKHANFNNSIGKTTIIDKYESYKNKFGLYDMHGNTCEWCFDWYDEAYYSKCVKFRIVKNPVNKENGSNRIIRGGSYFNEADYCRSACRNSCWNAPGYRDDSISFRPAVHWHL